MISTLFTVAISLSSLVHGSAIPNSNKREAGILRLPVTAAKSSLKRQTVSPLENVQTGTRYMVEFSIGSPPQNIALSLDTGSSETWVNPTCANAGGATNVALCNSFPRFNPNASSTAKDLTFGTTLSYGKGTAQVEYFTDNFLLGGATVNAQQFGIATTSSDMPTGLMGVGPGIELTGYPIIIDSLATQGITNSRAFSLDLRGYETPDGAIIFGGIDTAKYSGALEKLPIIPAAQSPDGYPRYWVHMNSVGITKPGEAKKLYAASSTDPKGQPVFLDSGGTLSRLPTALVNAIVADFPSATEDGTSGLYLVDCAVGLTDGTVDFGFGNTVINVPFNEFIWHIQGLCYLGIAADDATPVLGDSFLRAAFVVYDQDNQNLHVANAKNCGTNLVPIGVGADAVPSIVGQCAGASSSSSSTSSSASSTSTASSSASITSTASSVSGFPTISASSTGPYALFNSSDPAGRIASYTTKLTTSTAYSTSSYIVGGVVTHTVVGYTTVCPVTEKVHPTGLPAHDYRSNVITQTIYATETYTISKCADTVTNCPYGHKTTSITPVSTTVYTHKYIVATIGGYPVAPYELVANPAPLPPTIHVVYPVPLQTLPAGVKPIPYPTLAAPSTTPAAELKPVIYSTVPSFAASSYVPAVSVPAYAPAASIPAGEKPSYSAYATGSLPSPTTVSFTGAADSMKVNNLWATAFVALGFLVMI